MDPSTSQESNDDTDVRASFDVKLQADGDRDQNSSTEHLTPENPIGNVISVQADAIGNLVIHNYPSDNQSSQVTREEKSNTSERELITDDVPESITVAKMMDQRLNVDDDALVNLLTRDDVKDRPLVVVSIAGAFRTGKSFVLNFFLRYLRNEGWKNENWFGDEETKITTQGQGYFFNFKRSHKGCTKDIRVCPEIFNVPLEDGRMAAVILVDTQGLYEPGLTADSNARIMSISMLLSSLRVQHYEANRVASSRISRTLDNLSAASASFKITSRKDKAFQDLKIFVRDYEHGEFAFGKSNNYLTETLEELSRISEMDEVNQSVKSAFSGLECFLMAHPGKAVARCGGPGIQNKEVDEDFQNTVKELVEDVFDRANLSAKKKMDGTEADSTDLLYLLGQVGKAYENGDAPTARTLMQVQVKADSTRALSLAVSIYEENMSENCSGKLLTDDDINKASEKAMKKAENGFHDNAKMGDEKDKKMFLIQLQRECGDKLTSFHERNKEGKEKILTHGKYMVIDYMNRYHQAIQQKVENMTLESFQLLHETLKTENMARFDAEMEKYEQIATDILKLRADLESGIECSFDRFEAPLKIQLVEKSKMIEKFSKKVDELPLHFEKEDEIEALSTLLDDCIVEYSKITLDKTDGDDSLADLKATLVNRKEEAIKLNTTKRDYFIRICEEEGNFLGNFLGDSLEEELVQGFIAKDCFQSYVDQFIHEYLDSWLIGNNKLPEWGKKIVRQNLDEKVSVIWRRNNDNKSFRSIRFGKLKKPSEKMSPATRDVIESSLRDL